MLILSVFEYWLGRVENKIKTATYDFLPANLDAIPLRAWDPNDNQLVSYQGSDAATEALEHLEWEAGYPAT